MESPIIPILFFVMFLLSCTEPNIIKWNSKVKYPVKEVIKIHSDLLYVPTHNTTIFNRHLRKFKDYTLDHKCKMGLDLSVGFFLYTPYVHMSNEGWTKMVLSGILPHLVRNIVGHCCPQSNITFGELYRSIEQLEKYYGSAGNIMDITFPLYGLQGLQTTLFKDNPFIPLVEAPRIVLLVPNALFEGKNTRTQVLLNTIFNSWPMLIFIFVSASLSGLAIWMCDRKVNPSEFPPPFFVGAWEGFWWAFVTMTTVGYGDRSPKSMLARAFCIVWILTGLVLISLFTGLVSAALNVSSTPVFNVPGAKIGAVGGSKEYQVGVGLNADMKAYSGHGTLMDDLIRSRIDGALIDNFIMSAIRGFLVKYKLRIDREYQQPVTYGVSLKHNSSEVEKCFRKYVRHNSHNIFATVAKHLKPVKNPTDDVSLEVQAAEKLFYEEKTFKLTVYIEVGILGTVVFFGMVWEFCVRNRPTGKYNMFSRKYEVTNTTSLQSNNNFILEDKKDNTRYEEINTLITEYSKFHEEWIDKLTALRKHEETILIIDSNGHGTKV